MTRLNTVERGNRNGVGMLIVGGLVAGLGGAVIADVATPDISDRLPDVIHPAPNSALASLFSDWGQGSLYDMDCDGIVDIRDFLMLLSEVANGAVSASALPGLLDDWGQGSPWDLNCDGTVNVEDMLALLAQTDPGPFRDVVRAWGEDTHNDLNCDGTVGILDLLALLAHMADGVATPTDIDDLLGHWGQDTSQDRDCDGTVGIGDLMIQISGGDVAEL